MVLVGDRGPELWDGHGIPSRVVVWGWGEHEGTFDPSWVVVVAWGEREGIVTPPGLLFWGHTLRGCCCDGGIMKDMDLF